jgi:hypothetical protein
VILDESASAARRGYAGPPKPGQTPGPCQPSCGNGLCGGPDGCGGTCGCTAPFGCIGGVCAPPCEPIQCTVCITDGLLDGCFWETTLTCSDTADCQSQLGGSLCEVGGDGQSYCFVPKAPV